MALTIEDGTIIEDADSYATLAEADARAIALGNLTWADLDQAEIREPALRAGFNYLNTRWDASWKGSRIRSRDLGDGKSLSADDITFSAPSVITTGGQVDFTVFVDGQLVRVSGSPLNSGDFHVNGDPTALILTVTETTIQPEPAGDDILIEGLLLEQLGAWPRRYVVTPEGWAWSEYEIPKDVVNANIEYAFVAVDQSLNLAPVPTVDASGRALTRLTNKAGPVEQTKEWADGTIEPIVIRNYPLADALVQRWVIPQRGVIR